MDKIKLNETLTMKGHVKLTVRDALTGKIIPGECQEFDNIIVTVAKTLIGNALRSAGYINMTHCGVGSGSTPVASGNTALETQIESRKAITDASLSGNVVLLSTFFASADNNGNWNESGIFNAATDGTMLSHALFGTTFIKNSSKTATVDWSITLS